MNETSREQTSSSRAPPVRMRVFVALAVIPLLGGGAFAVTTGRSTAPQTPPPSKMTVSDDSVDLAPDAPQWRYVELGVANSGDPLPPVSAPGRVGIDEKRTASVSSPLAGQVDQVLVRIGERVKQGDRLFAVRSGALADLQHDIEAARASVDAKTAVVDRLNSLVKLQAASERDLLAAQAELREAQLQLRTAESRRRSLRITEHGDTQFWVTAPQSGTVVELNVVANQQVSPDREAPLLRISDLGEVIVLADVQERDAGDLHAGMDAQIRTTASSDDGRQGTIEHVSEVVDPQRRTVEVRVRVKNDTHALRPNAFVEVTPTPSGGDRTIRVPTAAVVTSGNRAVVFVAGEAGKLRRVPVQLGRERDGEVEIRRGLEPGARYVAKGALLLLNQIELNNT